MLVGMKQNVMQLVDYIAIFQYCATSATLMIYIARHERLQHYQGRKLKKSYLRPMIDPVVNRGIDIYVEMTFTEVKDLKCRTEPAY